MCLTIENNQDGPWNKKPYRWKVYRKYKSGILYSPYTYMKWSKNWNHAKYDKSYANIYKSRASQYGFHVFLTRKEARQFAGCDEVVRKVKVSGHLESGYYCSKFCETWKKLKIINY